MLFHFFSQQKLKACLPVIGAVFNLFFLSFVVPVEPIVLHPQLLPFVPKEFFVAEVLDNRNDKSAVGWVYSPAAIKLKPTLQIINFKGGGTAAMQDFILQSLLRNKTLRPIVIRIKECKITETIAAASRVEGNVALSVTFELQNETGNIYLTDYSLDTKYNRPENQLNIWAPALQESFISALKYFNTWMDQQADHNPKLAKVVKVQFKNHHEKLEGDTIYYSPNRLLTWADFQDKPQGGKYAAMVFPSFGFEEKREIANGEIHLNLDLKVYLPKSASWVKAGNQNDYSLNHEQRHFDLVAIVGKHFEQKIKAAKLPVNNFDGWINVEYYESFREMNRLQKQYDDETEHGINQSKQEEWNIYIDKELSKLNIVKAAL
ncbi:MAG: hypothetical protein ACRYGB_14580 [Janthinobacterium lividum]